MLSRTEEEKKEANRAACKRWAASHKDYNKTRQRKYLEENYEKVLAKNSRLRVENLERYREYSRESYFRTKTNDRPSNKNEYKLWWSAKKRANKSGITFTLERSDIIIPSHCPCCFKEMVVSTATAPSLDRMDSSKGYSQGNIDVICRTCNTIKSFGTIEQHQLVIDYMLKALH